MLFGSQCPPAGMMETILDQQSHRSKILHYMILDMPIRSETPETLYLSTVYMQIPLFFLHPMYRLIEGVVREI